MSAPLLFAMLHALERIDGKALPPQHRLVLLVLADFADDAGRAWPSAATVAKRTGQSLSTVEVVLAELEAAGWLVGERRHAGARPLSTVFEVRATGVAVARTRPGRHTPPLGVSDTPRGTPCPAHHAPHTMPGGAYTPPLGVSDTPPLGVDPIRIPKGSDLTHSAGAREVQAEAPPAPARTVELDPGPPHRPGDDLLTLCLALAAEGHVWCSKVAAGLAGKPLSDGQRRKLREIRAEREQEARAPPRARGPGYPVQPQGDGGPIYQVAEDF